MNLTKNFITTAVQAIITQIINISFLGAIFLYILFYSNFTLAAETAEVRLTPEIETTDVKLINKIETSEAVISGIETDDVKLINISDDTAVSCKTAENREINDKTNQVWLRLKSRFKTSEIELARKKYGRTFRPPSETTEINASAGGGTAEILLNADKKTGEVISTAVKTTEIFIESGENLFYLHCYNCHFDHSRLKIAPELAGRNFWIKYNDSKDNSIIKVVRKGRRTKDADMPAYGIERLNEKEAEAIVTYLESMLQPVNGDVY